MYPAVYDNSNRRTKLNSGHFIEIFIIQLSVLYIHFVYCTIFLDGVKNFFHMRLFIILTTHLTRIKLENWCFNSVAVLRVLWKLREFFTRWYLWDCRPLPRKISGNGFNKKNTMSLLNIIWIDQINI